MFVVHCEDVDLIKAFETWETALDSIRLTFSRVRAEISYKVRRRLTDVKVKTDHGVLTYRITELESVPCRTPVAL